MRIEVFLSGWEQSCCGTDFALGSEVTWQLLAEDPALASRAPSASAPPLPRYLEEHHGETPDDVPHLPVTGIVRRIRSVVHPTVPEPGEPRSFTADLSHPEFGELSEVARQQLDLGPGHHGYLAEIEMPDDWVLPEYVLSASAGLQAEAQRQRIERDRARMADETGLALETTYLYAVDSYGGVAELTRNPDRSAVTVRPHRPHTTSVSWARNSFDHDGILIQTGEGSWTLTATPEHAELVRIFLDAAAAGRIAEEITELGGGGLEGLRKRLDTVVRSPDGEKWVSSTSVEPIGDGGGVLLVAGDLLQRIERGPHRYAAW